MVIPKIKIILHFPVDVWKMFISYLPGAIGFKLRYRFWKNRLKFLGKNVKIDVGVYFQNPQFISIETPGKIMAFKATPTFSPRKIGPSTIH